MMARPSEAASQAVSRASFGLRMFMPIGQWLKAKPLLRYHMVTCEWLEEEIRTVVPDCNVEAIDLNGTQDHFHVRIIAEFFEGMRPLQRQKLVLNHFKPYIPNPIHAIDLKCMTPAQAETAGDTVFHPHAGGTGIHIKKILRHQNKEREK